MIVAASWTVPARATEDKPAPAFEPLPKVPLRVDIVMTRLQGDKKIASYPYKVSVVPGRPATIRMGTEVPIPVTTKDETVSFQYRNVGTNLECHAEAVEKGRYRLTLNVEHSSLGDSVDVGKAIRAPMFLTRNARAEVILRDGETQTYTTAADPTTGDVVKIDVTLDVGK
jgi:Flp pilus assembly secretin CpaC